jgi:hypothetical protein
MVARTNTVALCTSKLQPFTGISLIPQVIYEHGPPWWNDINKGKLLIHPPVLSDNPTRSHLVAKQEELANKMINFALQRISFILPRVL